VRLDEGGGQQREAQDAEADARALGEEGERVDQNHTLEHLGVFERRRQRQEPAEGLAEERRALEARVPHDAREVVHQLRHQVTPAPAQGERNHRVVAREVGRLLVEQPARPLDAADVNERRPTPLDTILRNHKQFSVSSFQFSVLSR
jgi:hypothetical protein